LNVDSARHIAVVTRRFPKVSETFVLFEMLALESLGLRLSIHTLAPPSDAIRHPDVDRLRAPIELIQPASPGAILRRALRSPWRTMRSMALAARDLGSDRWSGWREAVALADTTQRSGATALYAHFIDRPAAITRIAAALSGLPYAISAHAKDIYLTPPAQLRRRMRDARFVTTCTEFNAGHLRALCPEARVLRTYHGIDPQRFDAKRPVSTADSIPLILSVGRLRAKKGFDTLIAACAQLAMRGVPFRCEIIGYGPEEAALKQQIDRLGLASRVTLLGKCSHAQVLQRMAAAAVFALPSRIEENGDRDGVPNVILEAMASGTPVVSTRISGIPEAVQHDATGLLVEPDDAPALSRALQQVLADPALARHLAGNGRATVLGRFSREKNILPLASQLRRLTDDTPQEIAYIVKGFPRLSESFITNEILQLESQGMALRIYTLKGGEQAAMSALDSLQAMVQRVPATSSLSATTLRRWLLANGARYAPAMARVALRHPWRFARTLLAAVRMMYRYRKTDAQAAPRKTFVKEFLQAAWIADSVLRHAGVRHLHGHFCHGATTITWFISELTGMPFSFTAHAKDIYQADLNPGDLLVRKLQAARFAVTCTGANHEHLLGSAGPVACRGLHTVYHGLDVTRFAPPAARGEDGAPLLLTVGRHVEKKGFLTLIEACHLLASRGLDFRCEIVGEEAESTPAMRALIARHGLADRIHLLPPVPQARLGAYYERASLFVLPCTVLANGDRDGIPNVLAEAMATGLPVVTTPISGIPEIVEDDFNGLFVPSEDAIALANGMARLLQDGALRAKLGHNARQTILEKFDSARTTRRLRALLSCEQEPVSA
jgi:glycosyltransferase involved in cell wall biosynthesis